MKKQQLPCQVIKEIGLGFSLPNVYFPLLVVCIGESHDCRSSTDVIISILFHLVLALPVGWFYLPANKIREELCADCCDRILVNGFPCPHISNHHTIVFRIRGCEEKSLLVWRVQSPPASTTSHIILLIGAIVGRRTPENQ